MFFLIILPYDVYGIEIHATPEKDPFKPNDWIKILLDIDGYVGGQVEWTIHKPDNSTESGTLINFKARKITHSIGRNAFDNLFGVWSIEYTYKNYTKTLPVTVAPLIIDISTDKPIYSPNDDGTIAISTNYFEPNAAKAEDYFLQILDSKGNPVQHIGKIAIKAYRPSTTIEFSPADLVRNNPYGSFKILVKYFSHLEELTFDVLDPSAHASVFIGTDKSIYDPGDIVEVQLVVSNILGKNALVKTTDPSGKVVMRSVPIENSLTRIYLDDVPTTVPGTYFLEIEYMGTTKTKPFTVDFDTVIAEAPTIDLTLELDKITYRPGETVTASIKTDKLIASKIEYWLQNPSTIKTSKISFSMPDSFLIIPFVVSPDSSRGPWKMYVDYGGAVRFAIFFVEGEAVATKTMIPIDKPEYKGPKILKVIDQSITSLKTPKGISIDGSTQDIYLVNSGDSEIKKFNSEVRLLHSWGSFGSEDGQFKNPSGILVESDFVHVADTGNSRIQTFDKDGNHIRSWGNSGIESNSLVSPVSIAVDDSGIFYISDTNLNKIPKYDSGGGYVGHITPIDTASAKFSSSDFILSGGNMNKDTLLILVSDDDRIVKYRSDGSFVNFLGITGFEDGKFQNPTSMSRDKKGNLYVADSGNNRIQVFDSSDRFVGTWGSLGTGQGQFQKISSLAVNSKGEVLVGDSTKNQIQIFESILEPTSLDLDIPDWVRNNAQWWSENQISDTDFTRGIQYMIEHKILIIPNLDNDVTEEQESNSGQQTLDSINKPIPDWIKNNAAWWADGLISDRDFATGIEFLVRNGIIQV